MPEGPKLLKLTATLAIDYLRLAYVITTRRLLILEGNRVKDAYPPERLYRPSIRERAPGYADVSSVNTGGTASGGRRQVDQARVNLD